MSYIVRSIPRANTGRWTEVRSVALSAGEIAADSATLTDANILPALGLNCNGFQSILVRPVITAGTNPSLTVEALFRDPDAADGARWHRVLLGAPAGVTPIGAPAAYVTPTLQNGQAAELQVFGHHLVYLRVTSVTNKTSTTAGKLYVLGGVPLPYRP